MAAHRRSTDAPATVDAAEHRALREGCGLLDRSERGKLALTGADAIEFLNGQVTNELADLQPGEGRYAAFLTHKGKMLGDLRVLAVGERAGRACRRAAARHRARGAAGAVRHDPPLQGRLSTSSCTSARSSAAALADRPRAERRSPAPSALGARRARQRRRVELDGVAGARGAHRRRASTCSATAADTRALERGAARARRRAGRRAAAECLRVEHGRPRYGVDLDDTVIPQEAGLNERAVSFTKGCYVGQETVARLYYRGKPNRHLRGPAPVRAGRARRAAAARRAASSGASAARVVSPRLGPIALALVRREAEPGRALAVGGRARRGRGRRAAVRRRLSRGRCDARSRDDWRGDRLRSWAARSRRRSLGIA